LPFHCPNRESQVNRQAYDPKAARWRKEGYGIHIDQQIGRAKTAVKKLGDRLIDGEALEIRCGQKAVKRNHPTKIKMPGMILTRRVTTLMLFLPEHIRLAFATALYGM
jgi:hypothetical protein